MRSNSRVGCSSRAPEEVGRDVNVLTRRFGSRQPTPVQVRWQDGEPVEFQRRPTRKAERFLVTDVREHWIEESPWPFPSPMPVGGDRVRCWRVIAQSASELDQPAEEYVLRMRAGPGVWDLLRVSD
jgi:hypothetical protein